MSMKQDPGHACTRAGAFFGPEVHVLRGLPGAGSAQFGLSTRTFTCTRPFAASGQTTSTLDFDVPDSTFT